MQLSKELGQQLVNYLSKRPYAEVYQFINPLLQELGKEQEPSKDKAPKK